jgi:hypothetical protein
MSTTAAHTWGLLAQFDSPGAILRAAREVRDAGYNKFDVHTPFPVHGMDAAMGLGRSHLGWIVSAGALAGGLTAIGLQYYVGWDYPLVHQGKPPFAWQPFVIVTFELTVLFSSFAAVIGMLALNGLPQWYHPALKSQTFAKASNDRFMISIEAKDPKFNSITTREFLASLGAVTVEDLTE